ncbi:hypothetical protein SRABI128_06394 [Microbacterium sp. Bi128]|nr:hypothetical protein SRABI128_06394 [Microbacterium sp. Bi128]
MDSRVGAHPHIRDKGEESFGVSLRNLEAAEGLGGQMFRVAEG